MWKLLISALGLVALTITVSLLRFGLTLDGFMRGDGNAVLEAGSVLVSIWALIVGLSVAAIGATFQLSSLPPLWKRKLFQSYIIWRIMPFVILSLLAGVIPFFAILNTDTNMSIRESPVTSWLIAGFFLETILIWAAWIAATWTYQSLTLIPAMKITLSTIDEKKLCVLKEATIEAFQKDFVDGHRIALIPMSGFGRSLSGSGALIHDDLLIVFTTFIRETNPQVLDQGVRVISEWARTRSLKDIDSYLEYRLIPSCFHTLRTDQKTFLPIVFKSRLYYLSRLIDAFKESGASLTAANFANPLWEIIEEYSAAVGMVSALEQAELALDFVLARERLNKKEFSILLNNLLNGVSRLVFERSSKGIYWLDRILLWHRRQLVESIFTKWPHSRSGIEHVVDGMKYIYQKVDEFYSEEQALFVGKHDIRYWILINLRRIQEEFVGKVKPESINGTDHLAKAAQDFDYIDTIINELLKIRIPAGDPDAYVKKKYLCNPYKNLDE